MKSRGRLLHGFAVASAFVVLQALVACSIGSSPSANVATGPINLGLLFSFTGPRAAAGASFSQGAQAAIQTINANGGVLGRPLQIFSGDTAGDPVDAVPALRQLLIHNPAFLVGPTSLEFDAVHNIIDSAPIPSFAIIPSTEFDKLQDKWVYNILASDSQQGKASAYYAIKQGWTKCALMFDNSQASQSLVTPLTTAYSKNGGTVTANVTLTTGLSSYRSEVVQAFAGNPQCVFLQMDQSTAGTVFSNARDLGHLNVPYIGTNVFSDPLYAKAIGPADDSKWVTTTQSAPSTGATFDYFSQLFKAQFGVPPAARSAATYDSVVIAALAMTDAGSADPKVWVSKISDVVNNETGQEVTNYQDGVQALKQGKKIDYEGASAPMDFDQYHSITTGWQIEQFDPTGKTLHIVFPIPAVDLEKF
jgi:branched-chain amino acid transport system substrate-binding protein